MTFINSSIQGAENSVTINKTHPKHITGSGEVSNRTPGNGSFKDILTDSIEQVQQKQDTVNGLMEQMLINPDSVAVHDITTAIAQSELSLRTTKAVVDRAVRAYTDIVNMR